MPDYTQTDRPLKITTPLGEDILLLTGFEGHEEISHLFDFHVTLLADLKNEVKFDGIIGQSVTVEMRTLDGDKRYFNGIVKRFSQGARDEHFLHFKAQIVPKLWFLTKKVRSRIFQHLTIPDILRQVLTGLDVNYEISGTYYQRDFCVQYRESDFDFASRLMEEEGIYYFFKHSDGNHQMVVTDIPNKHPTLPGQSSVIYEEATGSTRTDMRITAWEKIQELRAGECTLWDHCFELPGNHLEAKEKTIASVPVGKVTHKLNLANDSLELYDFPGCYAQRFDGIDPSGGDRPSDIQHIFDDRTRTVRLRMEQEEVSGILIEGESDCGQFTAGHKFTLERHFDADAGYLLTRIEHNATLEAYRSDEPDATLFHYGNHFRCIPEALRFRPQRVTRKPVIAGMQTATVVGPAGEEIFVDKYGRVKVQFHWDREGKMNADSSCWLRVAQVWAGKGWGGFFWPRIGHEVVVLFEEGDPDQPLITGSVYNADNMPWFALPAHKDYGGIKSSSVHGTAAENYNGIVFVDRKGKEHLTMHSERHMVFNAEFDKTFRSGRHQAEKVPGARAALVGSLPTGGGSGGGGPDENIWTQPEPQAVLGLNSTVVYGGQFAVTVPLNFQLAVGSNIAICFNPASFAPLFLGNSGALPESLTQVMGSGMGGNIQLTLGTNTAITLGQPINVNVGPRPINLDSSDKALINPAVPVLGAVIGAAAALFLILYGVIEDDDGRAALLIVFQVLIQVLLGVLMGFHMLYHSTEQAGNDALRKVFTPEIEALKGADLSIAQISAIGAILTVGLAPIVLESIGEARLDS